MKMETHNTQTKITTEESPVYIDEVDIFHPVEDETARLLREELEVERDKRLRLAAEYENYRRRTMREQATAAEKGKRELLRWRLCSHPCYMPHYSRRS